jgi:zinc/manganese transport system substrate-binding protein
MITILIISKQVRRLLASALALVLLLGACGDSHQSEGLTVVATTTVLWDVVGNVVADDGDVEVLLPIGADPHDFRLSARQVALINEADLVVTNGLGLEGSMDDVLAAASDDGVNVLTVAPLLDPIPLGAGDDPHVWFDPLRMKDAAVLIADELTLLDDSVGWADRASVYGKALDVADVETQRILSSIVAPDRKLVTNHDSLGYFASRYEFEILGTVIPGGSSLANPSSADLADLVNTMEAEGTNVIFAETTEPTALAETVADEVGGDVLVVELFTGSLGGPGSGAENLIDMLLTNARRIAEALGS